MDEPALANDKYRATLRSTFIDGSDITLAVTAIPTNVPTIVTVGWNTQYETVFRVEGTSGTNSSNYALTGITKIKGYTGNLPENSAVNCLNHEEYFNQYGDLIDAIQVVADDAEAAATAAQEDAAEAILLASNQFLTRQLLINGNFDIWQRNTTFTTPNDDVYGPDRWVLLVDGNGAWTFARDTDVPTGGDHTYSLKASNVTANKQCAIVQLIENIDATKFQGKTVSLTFKAKTNSTEISNLRATILSWTGTANSPTSDVIGTWAGNGTDPTFAASYTKEIAGANKTLTSSWQEFTVDGIVLDTAAITNLAVVIWVDDTTITSGDDFYITGIQLNEGATAVDFKPKSFAEELRACLRYYQKSFNYAVAPAQAVGSNLGALFLYSHHTTEGRTAMFKVPMRTAPTVTTYSPTSANNQWYDTSNGQDRGVSVSNQSESGFEATSTTFSAGAYLCYLHWAADAEL